MAAAGVVGLLLGAAGVLILLCLALFDVQFAAVLLLIDGAALLVASLGLMRSPVLPWLLALAGIHGAVGTAVLLDPLLTAGHSGYIAAAGLLAAGVFRLAITRHLAGSSGRFGLTATGVAAILLGAVLIAGELTTALFWVALFLSLEMLLGGVSRLLVAATARRLS